MDNPLTVRGTSLRGRGSECGLLDELLAAVRQGESRSLVLRGEPGIGKTALLEYLVETASDLTVVRGRGCGIRDGAGLRRAAPAVRAAARPARARCRRRNARRCEIVFGVSAGAPPDRFLVGLAVLSLLVGGRPRSGRCCASWTTRSGWTSASAQTLAFVARRLLAEPVGLVFAAREPGEELSGPARARGARAARRRRAGAAGLGGRGARSTSGCATGSSPRRAAIRWRCSSCPAGCRDPAGRGVRAARAPSRCRAGSRRATCAGSSALPDADAGVLLLVAAAEPIGDPLLLQRAAERLGLDPSPRPHRRRTACSTLGERVTFRHPLVRSAVYRSATRARAPGGAPGAGRGDRPRTSTRTAGRGTSPRRRVGSGRGRSRWSWSVRPAGRRRAAASPQRRRSCSGRSR